MSFVSGFSPWEGSIVKGTGTWEYVITNQSIYGKPLCHTDHMFRYDCDYQVRTGEDRIVAWGYEGNGPRQLAFAILAYGCWQFCRQFDVYRDWRPMARRYSEAFMKDFVSQWGDQWKITLEEVVEWVKKQEEQKDQDERDKVTEQVGTKD